MSRIARRLYAILYWTLGALVVLVMIARGPSKHPASWPDPASGQQNPPPGASVQVPVLVPASMQSSPFDVQRFLNVPPNFTVSVFARLDDPRRLAFAPNGDLLVSQPNDGTVSLIRPNPGSAPTIFTYASGLRSPHGIVFHTVQSVTYVYVSETFQIDRYIYNTGDTAAHDRQVVVANLPDAETPGLSGSYEHPLKNIAIDSNDKLYVSVGSTCNVCALDVTSNPRRAAIYQYNADGTNPQLFATGLRNAEGLALLPGSNELWAVVNERDDIPYPFNDSTGQYGQVIPSYVNNHPPDEFTRVRAGGNYGWPFCDPDPDTTAGLANMPFDPDYQMNKGGSVDCSTMDRITQGIQAHSAPLSLVFLQGTAFPQAYQDGAIVGLHGSWDRQTKTGYEIAYFPWNDLAGTPGSRIDLVTGWLDPATQEVWGRPVDTAVDQAGNLYISDDQSGTIYELSPVPVVVKPSPTPTPPQGPTITSVTTNKKNLVVVGKNFDSAANLLVNGQAIKTVHPPASAAKLVGKGALKEISPGQTVMVQIRNSDGTLSAQVPFTRP